jgi:hypothetical protein
MSVTARDSDGAAGDFEPPGGTRPLGVSIRFSPQAYAVAQRNAALLRVPVAEGLREALALQQAVIEAAAGGARVLVEKRGRVQELAVRADPDR